MAIWADWRLSPEDWKTLCEGIPGLEQRQATGDPQVGEAVIWCMVNESSYLHSPAVTQRRSTARSPHRLTEQAGLFANRNQRRPSYIALRHRLMAYATQLARACDEGTDLQFEALSWVAPAATRRLDPIR
ncbi:MULTISPECIES: hypothetical protein [unclassified Streptomyces]|uniref:hypothetical protein n=1 Tax=unclassified Streptomyces TaxID=2593676 RepID=UPI00224CA009|nr:MULTISPECIES: hypothetical protein [unclassified Streptomyces]MCX4524379.1 hypothetical protein [Streptomyces sp. NBC_01551]MCX4545099.1 hypothetical protein [Streptomyces sp. NBC_01565]